MRNIWFLVGLPCFLFLVGCAGVGIVATSDPNVKLSDAEYLYRNYDRPLPAEKLISEAIEIYQKQGNLRGLGNAYREYGSLLLSPSLTKWGFHNMNFHDRSVADVTYENRVAKASEYFRKALEVYEKYEPQPLEAKQYDELTNLYYVTAWTYNGLHEPNNSCKYFDKSLAAYAENIRLNPTAKPIVPRGFNSFPELVASDKKFVRCDGSTADEELSDTSKLELEKLGGSDCSESAPAVSAETYFRRGKSLVALNEYKPAMVCLLRAQEEKDTQVYRDSCSQIAMMYELGWGVDKDMETSKAWLKKAGQ